MLAVTQLASRVPVPTPLPPAPPAPVTDLGPVRDRLAAPQLAFDEQQVLVTELRSHVTDTDQRATVVALLETLRDRPDAAASVARDVERMLAELPVVDEQPRRTRQRRPLAERDPDVVDLLRSLVSHIRSGHFTPIVGPGLTDALIGPRSLLARQWAKTFEFPMAAHQQNDLPGVAQFVAVMTNAATLQASLTDHLLQQLPGDAADTLDARLHAAWQRQVAANPSESHTVLASLPCPVYICAHPWDLLPGALRAAGRDPVVELCQWRADVYDWPRSIFDTEPSYVPSVERPLVYQVFGHQSFPDSLVVTEDDYFGYLVGVTQGRTLIPPVVRRVLADSALLLLGFGLEDWDVRVLLRTLVSQEGAHKLHRYTHVAAQVDLSSSVVSPARAQRYLERYFGKFREPSIDIYWGTVEDFAADLAEIWAARR